MTLNAKIGGFTDFFRDIGLRMSISFTRRRHRRQRHTRLWPMCIMVPMGRVQVICDLRNYNHWTVNAIGFRASRELCSNFLFSLPAATSFAPWLVCPLCLADSPLGLFSPSRWIYWQFIIQACVSIDRKATNKCSVMSLINSYFN